MSKSLNSAKAVLAVNPSTFGYDDETAGSNAFQHQPLDGLTETRAQAREEFNAFVDALRSVSIDVTVADEQETSPAKPSAVFPNNWFSTWPNGTVYLYPMATASRRVERSPTVLDELAARFEVRDVVHLSENERDGEYLESTGVMVFDHCNRYVFATPSERCSPKLFEEHARNLGYSPVAFQSRDPRGNAIYHTNILLAIQSHTAVVCDDTIDSSDRERVLSVLHSTGRDVVSISYDQMSAFSGNCLEVQNTAGETFLVMSQGARDALNDSQVSRLSAHNKIISSPLPTIERVGGGSARCMLAEVFLEHNHRVYGL